MFLIQGCLTDSHNPHTGVSYYNLLIRDSLATLIHPNEFFDGAFTLDARDMIVGGVDNWGQENWTCNAY